MDLRPAAHTATPTLSVNLTNIQTQLASFAEIPERERQRIQEIDMLLTEKRRVETEEREALGAAQADLEGAQKEGQRLQSELDTANREWQDLREKRSSVQARLASYRELRDSYDGFAEGVQAVMQAKRDQRQEGPGTRGPHRHLLPTRPPHPAPPET